MKSMKLILTHEVTGLGEPGDVVEVKPGYGRNYLVPRDLATPWSKGGEKQVEAIKKAREARAVKSLDEAKNIKAQLENKPVKVKVKSGAGGRLFGSVSTTTIVDAFDKAGLPSVDRRRIEVTSPIKALGAHSVVVRVHPEVAATVRLDVIAD
ncbi:50S ribosomal protein L9 [Arsenicicoccus piscis]|uniref:Large ribosomal subunit protein bL9 n=2 Tax=Arsenicicoccus piscis TaxID=673954 RepID=A0ABQ6HT99_9MICO|nr:50S ribosomal protein L9 [Arsenicicoccus piscis]